MCGRFVSASPPDEIARYFDAEAAEAALEPSYNVAPTNDVYVVHVDGRARRVEPFTGASCRAGPRTRRSATR